MHNEKAARERGDRRYWILVFDGSLLFWMNLVALKSYFQLVYALDLLKVESYVKIILVVLMAVIALFITQCLARWLNAKNGILLGLSVSTAGILLSFMHVTLEISGAFAFIASGLVMPHIIAGVFPPKEEKENRDSVPIAFIFLLAFAWLAVIIQSISMMLQFQPEISFDYIFVSVGFLFISQVVRNKANIPIKESVTVQKDLAKTPFRSGLSRLLENWRSGILPWSSLLFSFFTIFVFSLPVYVFPYLVVVPDLATSTVVFFLFSMLLMGMLFVGTFLPRRDQSMKTCPRSKQRAYWFLNATVLFAIGVGCFAIKDIFAILEGLWVILGTCLIFLGIGATVSPFIGAIYHGNYRAIDAVVFLLAGIAVGCFIYLPMFFSVYFINLFYAFLGGLVLASLFFTISVQRRFKSHTTEGST